MTADDITIAITVYDRRTYIGEAIRSALAQKTAGYPKVKIVEDCGPDESLRAAIVGEFGDQIDYVRNPRRRGLFDNWNACIEACETPWLCILHDDDSLKPGFVEAMIELSNAAPGRGLYYGQGEIVDEHGTIIEGRSEHAAFSWRELPLEQWARYDPVCFPTQLFNVEAARALGGFRPSSRYCADWEMWFKLAFNYGAAATDRIVATYREHHSIGRGTTNVNISGRKFACTNMQRKRHFAWLRRKNPAVRFDRKQLFTESAMPTRFILEHGYGFSPRMLRYNAGLLYLSSPPHLGYRVFQAASRFLSWRSLYAASWIYRLIGNHK